MTTSLELDRASTSAGAIAEYEAFADLVASLDAREWATPTRCEGFDVCDVAGHVIGLAEDVAKGVPGTRNAEEEAASVRSDPPAQAAARLRAALEPIRALLSAVDDATWNGPSGVPDLTLGDGVLLLWYDAYVHADDIRAAIGRESARGDGLNASIVYLVGQLSARGYGPVTLELDGMPQRAIGTGGSTVTGDALAFVLAATGRTAPEPLGLEASVNIYA
jgi:uncharacterized protein (TIGR03083 family)